MSDHVALAVASTISKNGDGSYFAVCQVCRKPIRLDQGLWTGGTRESWKHDD